MESEKGKGSTFYVNLPYKPTINKSELEEEINKIVISDFNNKFYTTNEYKTQSLMLNLDYQLIIVKTFDKENPATNYLEAVKNSAELKELTVLSDYEHFIISSSNFKVFYKNKSLDQYLVYFEDAFLKY